MATIIEEIINIKNELGNIDYYLSDIHKKSLFYVEVNINKMIF